jgi:type II secretory pathway pseudopilin PulG
MTKKPSFPFRASDFGIHSSFVIRLPRRSCAKAGHSSFRGEAASAFTLLELLIVITIIIILAGLTIATMGYVQGKARRSRAEAEIAAISAALENYKADNGVYPQDGNTNALAPNTTGDPTSLSYKNASLSLYKLISGDSDNDNNRIVEAKSYFSFRPNQLYPDAQNQAVTFIRDPFVDKSGKPCSYGYSTVKASSPNGTDGYNPTFDLWSTGGTTTSPPDQSQWIRNW